MKGELFTHGLFDKRLIQQGSILIHSVMLDKAGDGQKAGWVVYPDVYSVIGFLQYIYLPTVLTSILQGEIPEELSMEEEIDIIYDEYHTDDLDLKKEDVFLLLDDLYDQLLILWDTDESSILDELLKWNDRFQELIGTIETEITVSLKLFRSPEEAINHVVSAYEKNVGITQLEKEMGFTKDELFEFAKVHVYNNKFMQRKFISLLDGRITVLG